MAIKHSRSEVNQVNKGSIKITELLLEERLVIAYKSEEECSEQDRKVRAIEMMRCLANFWYFLNYVKIVETPTLNNPGGIIKFELWEHLKQVIGVLLSRALIVIWKPRQVGISWLLAIYSLWFALSHSGANILLSSKGELEAIELLAKCRRVYNQLPSFLRFKINPDSATEIGFPAVLSSIKAFAATQTAGISFTSSIVICDEWDEHPYADQNYLASKPTRDAGGQFIGVFTSNTALKTDTLAQAIFNDAHEGKNDFSWLFFPYDVRPGRSQGWYEDTRKNIPTRELATLTPDLYMHRNYPRNLDEARSLPESITAFDTKVITEMIEDCRHPLKVERDGIDSKIVHIYQDYHIGEYFIAGTDTSHGIGRDFSVTIIMNVRTGAIIADIMNNLVSPEELAMHSVRMLEIYKNPLWFIESNDWGSVTILKVQQLNYKNLGYQDEKKTKVGFNTNIYQTKVGLKGSKLDLFGELIPAFNNHQLVIYNIDGLRQFYDIIRTRDGKIEARPGCHDDYPMAVGIGLVKKDEVRVKPLSIKPLETLTFSGNRSGSRRWR